MTASFIHNNPGLIIKLSEGDEEAFAVFVKEYWKNIFGQALSYLKSTQLAEELTQDVFLKVWNARADLPNVTNVEGYLYTICKNAVLNELRKVLRPSFKVPDQEAVEELLRPDRQLEYREYHARLMTLIEQLPDKRRQVFKMSRLEGKTHEEIAMTLGISKDTVAQYIVKAINYLKTELSIQQADLVLISLLLGLSL